MNDIPDKILNNIDDMRRGLGAARIARDQYKAKAEKAEADAKAERKRLDAFMEEVRQTQLKLRDVRAALRRAQVAFTGRDWVQVHNELNEIQRSVSDELS